MDSLAISNHVLMLRHCRNMFKAIVSYQKKSVMATITVKVNGLFSSQECSYGKIVTGIERYVLIHRHGSMY